MKKRYWRQWLIFLLTALVIFIFDFWIIFQPFKSGFNVLINPIKKFLYSGKNIDFEQFFLTAKLRSLKEENYYLKEEILKFKSNFISSQEYHDENIRLRQLLEVPLPQDLSFLPAQVITQEKKKLLVNQGSKEGVFNHQLVLTGNCLVGWIDKVFLHQSDVLRVGSTNFDVPVLIFSNHPKCLATPLFCLKGKGILRGYLIEGILQDEPVVEGDLVSFLNNSRGILLGEITEVSKSDDKIFQKAKIKSLTDSNRLTEVFLLKE